MPYLIFLDLGYNPINSLASLNRKPAEGEEITFWPRLQFVFLNNTKIDKITPIAVPNLIKIDLSYNNISSVAEGDEGFKGYETIQELNISHTSISNLVPFKGMAKLKRLEASYIKMIMLGGLEGCEELEHINLSHGKVGSKIDPDFYHRCCPSLARSQIS